MIAVHLLTDDDCRAAARVFVRAFADKVAVMLHGHEGQAEAVFAELIVPGPNSWVAKDDGVVVGVVLCEDHAMPSQGEVQWSVLRRHLAWGAALRAWVVAHYLFTARFDESVLYVDSVAVDPDWQGRGVATALLVAVAAEARRRGRRSLTLYVIDRNARARSLYEHLGFVHRHTLHTWLFKPLVGFAASDYMELRLK
ncbi:MAG: GNAT family N-acetyltransferase [Thermoleophilia bacterium]